MHLRDITKDTENTYTLTENEQCVFFALNRAGDLTFILNGKGAAAHIVTLYTLRGEQTMQGSVTHIHQEPNTVSSYTGRVILFDNAVFDWQGLIRIHPNTSASDGRQDIRSLLLSDTASSRTVPSLEISTNDVRCSHASTTSSLPDEALFFLKSRGLSQAQAETLLIQGFLKNALEPLPIDQEHVQQLIIRALA